MLIYLRYVVEFKNTFSNIYSSPGRHRPHRFFDMKKTITIIVVCVAFLLLIVPTFMLWLIAAFADLSFHFIIPIIGFVLLTLIGFITFSIENKFFYKIRIILTSAVLLILIGIIEGENYYKHTYIPSITVGQRQPAAYRYKPFEKSENLAHLDGEASLKFTNTDDLPVVDGATALFPIYCSFVEVGLEFNMYPLGYSFRYYVETMEKNVNLKILKLNGIEASRENIRNKKYPITDNFYAITVKGRESENTRKFIDWMISAQGQEIIDKVGYVPLSDK